MLEVSNLSVVRGDHTVFEGVSFSLPTSTCLIIKGGNGTGKTTLLKTIAGQITPADGTIKFEGFDLNQVKDAYHNRMSYVGHADGLKPYYTVREYLDLWAGLYNGKELVGAAIAFLKLKPKLDLQIGKLSAGWKRRVSLSRLIIAQSDIWLLDEPLSHLDEESMEVILSLIATRGDQGGIIIFSYHGHTKIPFGQTLRMEDFA